MICLAGIKPVSLPSSLRRAGEVRSPNFFALFEISAVRRTLAAFDSSLATYDIFTRLTPPLEALLDEPGQGNPPQGDREFLAVALLRLVRSSRITHVDVQIPSSSARPSH